MTENVPQGNAPGPSAPGAKRPDTGAAGCFAILLYIATGVLALITALAFSSLDSDGPRCDGKRMRPGDTCLEIGAPLENGKVPGDTYEERLQAQRDGARNRERLRWPILAATIVSLAGAVLLTRAGIRRKRAQQRAQGGRGLSA